MFIVLLDPRMHLRTSSHLAVIWRHQLVPGRLEETREPECNPTKAHREHVTIHSGRNLSSGHNWCSWRFLRKWKHVSVCVRFISFNWSQSVGFSVSLCEVMPLPLEKFNSTFPSSPTPSPEEPSKTNQTKIIRLLDFSEEMNSDDELTFR